MDGNVVAEAADDRITAVDVLRGLALLGMFVVHFVDNFSMPPRDGVEHGIQRFSQLFLSDRFHTMFAILFGIGFAIQLRRADRQGRPFARRYLRRLAALAGFGIIAELFFGFQILFGYALWGIVLLPIRRLSTRALIALALLIGASRPIYSIARAAYYTPAISAQELVARDRAEQAAVQTQFQQMGKDLHSPSWAAALRARVARMRFYFAPPILPSTDLFYFIIGLLALRLGLIEEPRRHKTLLMAAAVFGIASWAISTWVFADLRALPLPPAGESYAPTVFLNEARRVFRLVRVQWLTLAYMVVVLLLPLRSRAVTTLLAPLAWAGRMALTNYMIQIAVLSTLFMPYALGFRSPLILAPILGVLLFGVQAAFSRWWLARYRYGPLEWVWRSITYWHVQPLRLESSPATTVGPIEALPS